MNQFYNAAGYPQNSQDGDSGSARAEFLAIQKAFDQMPALTGNAGKIILVNPGETGLTVAGGNVRNGISWTPTLSCDTPGDLVVAYTQRLGELCQFGQLLLLKFFIQTSTFTWTTASGTVRITGFPTISAAVLPHFGSVSYGGMTKAGYIHVVPVMLGVASNIYFQASGSGLSIANLAIADFPSAGTVFLEGQIVYQVGA